jgi:hypothetical protein
MITNAHYDALFSLNPSVRWAEEDGDSLVPYDADNNQVSDVNWDAVNTKAAELLAATNLSFLRKERNSRIAETDWWANSDTAEMTSDQTAYRQALRDITNSYQSLDDVVWPTKP